MILSAQSKMMGDSDGDGRSTSSHRLFIPFPFALASFSVFEILFINFVILVICDDCSVLGAPWMRWSGLVCPLTGRLP